MDPYVCIFPQNPHLIHDIEHSQHSRRVCPVLVSIPTTDHQYFGFFQLVLPRKLKGFNLKTVFLTRNFMIGKILVLNYT